MASENMKALAQLVRDMAAYVGKVPDTESNAKPPQQNELLQRYRALTKVIGG
jgi:hypothetical protein